MNEKNKTNNPRHRKMVLTTTLQEEVVEDADAVAEEAVAEEIEIEAEGVMEAEELCHILFPATPMA
jgi:hypothetical protein